MVTKNPSNHDWRALYALMGKIKALAPWEWMEESDLFGVQDPETGEQGFVGVMGMAGQHYCVSVYRGARALYQFWDYHDDPMSFQPETLFQIPQLMASFEDRDFLEKEDRAIIKQLGLKFRGANAWPLFRALRPGFFPWFIEPDEARFLTHALEQVLDVAPRFEQNSDLLDPFNDDRYLMRVPVRSGEQFVWHDEIVAVKPPAPIMIMPAPMADSVLMKLKKMSVSQQQLEVDCLIMPTPIQENRNSPPIMPYMLLIVDARTGMVLPPDLLQADPTLEAMYAQIPKKLVDIILMMPQRMKEIHVRSELMLGLLQPLAKDVGIQIKLRDELSTLDEAANAMFGMMHNIPEDFALSAFDDDPFFDLK
jgi:hypothetical protein